MCLTYKTRTTPYAGTLGTAKVVVTDLGDPHCTMSFVLGGRKSKGGEKTICDKSCPAASLENAIVKIQQKSWDGWGIEEIVIKNALENLGDRAPYSLDGKVKQFWVDGNLNGNYDGLLKCSHGKWCDLKKIGN